MIKPFKVRLLTLMFVAFGFFSFQQTSAQVQTPRYVSMILNSNAYYEYLPQGYNPSGSETYPLLIFVHGLGELGVGNSSTLPMVLRNGPPMLINNGQWPNSFTVNGQTHKLIVISPQFVAWPSPLDIDNIIKYCVQNYKVNLKRIYLTGLSMGGGVTWNYAGENSLFANRLAAIIPICGASWPDIGRSRTMAGANLPVWATHNDADPIAPLFYTVDYINNINQAPSPIPLAKKTIFASGSHDAWSATYNPSFRENGMNIYEWMLQYARQSSNIILPVTLSEYKASLTGASQVSVFWTTTHEENNDHFTLERSIDGLNFIPLAVIPGTNSNSSHNYTHIDNSPVTGNNFYRLSQTDVDGKLKYFNTIKVSVRSKREQTFVINPNPVRDNVMLELSDSEQGTMQVILTDILGKTIRNWSFQKTNFQWRQSLNISNIAQGTYVLILRGKNIKKTQQFIKQ